jgi:hypothetical protein
MNPALSCIEDTIRVLLEEAKEAKYLACAKRGTADEAFAIGRSQALTETLHTWSNQLQTFELARQVPGLGDELRSFLESQGY